MVSVFRARQWELGDLTPQHPHNRVKNVCDSLTFEEILGHDAPDISQSETLSENNCVFF